MSDDKQKMMTEMLETLLKGRADEHSRDDEVLDTVEAHHGKWLRRAAEAEVSANKQAIDLVVILAAMLPDELRPFCLEKIGVMLASAASTTYAMAAYLHNPHQDDEAKRKEVLAVHSLIKPLMKQVGETRKREARMASEVFDKLRKGMGDGEDS